MTDKDFDEWCKFFRVQLLRADEDSEFLDEWIRDLLPHPLADSKEAVMHCVRTSTRFDTPKKMLPIILDYLGEAKAIRERQSAPPITWGPNPTAGEAWDRRMFEMGAIDDKEFNRRQRQRKAGTQHECTD